MRINDTEAYDTIKQSITMTNLKKIIENKQHSIIKVAMHCTISETTLKAYMKVNVDHDNKKIPSLPTLISMADYLNCNIDYLLDRTNNPQKVDEINSLSKDDELNKLVNTISSLPKDKKELVNAYIQGLLK